MEEEQIVVDNLLFIQTGSISILNISCFLLDLPIKSVINDNA